LRRCAASDGGTRLNNYFLADGGTARALLCRGGACHMSWRLSSCVVAALLALSAEQAHAVVLDWDIATWSNGSLTNSFDIDPANPGNDITVSVTGNTAQFGTEPTGEKTPALTTNLAGGLSPVEKTLTLYIDLTNQSQSVTLTFNFSALYAGGVQNVSFSVFDVDFANEGGNGATFQDQLRSISATALDGTLVAPTITTSAANSLTGTGLSQVVSGTATVGDTGSGSNAGNVTISFGSTAISSFTFTYGGGTNTKNDPTGQHIGLHDINFTPVPEINPALTATLSCFAVTGLMFFHRARVRARRK
jgi:hypothetical protein